jgi:hypothetical protein
MKIRGVYNASLALAQVGRFRLAGALATRHSGA